MYKKLNSSLNNIPDSKGSNAYHRDKHFSKLLEFYSGRDMLSKIEDQFIELGDIVGDQLEDLALTGHKFPNLVLEWRQVSKLKSTYTDALQDHISKKTKRVHTSFLLAATNTGRLASSDPNLQNIPIKTSDGKEIRKAFIADKNNLLISGRTRVRLSA